MAYFAVSSLLMASIIFGAAINDLPTQSTICVLPESSVLNVTNLQVCEFLCHLNNLTYSSAAVIRSNTKIIFLQGVFHLDSVWNFTNLHNITLTNENSTSTATIDCRNNDSGIHFENSSNIKIDGLEIVNCGGQLKKDVPKIANLTSCSLAFLYGESVTITNIAIVNGSTAVFVFNVQKSFNITHALIDQSASISNNVTNNGINIIYTELCKSEITEVHIKELNVSNSGSLLRDQSCKIYNKSTGGLALILKTDSVSVYINDSHFITNYGCNGGGILIYLDNFNIHEKLSVSIHNTIFSNNYAIIGGGIYISFEWTFYGIPVIRSKQLSTAIKIDNCTFEENEAYLDGGGVYIQWKESISNQNLYQDVIISNCIFNNNSISPNGSGGLGIHFRTYVTSQDNKHNLNKMRVNLFVLYSNFTNHIPPLDYTRKQSLESSVILAKSTPYLNLDSVIISGNNCTAVLAISSIIVFSGDSEVSNNVAMTGAGLRLCSDSFIYFEKVTRLLITRNIAHIVGGGIFVDSKCLVNKPKCFYQFEKNVTLYRTLLDSINVTISDNYANQTGSNLYGGSIDYCFLYFVKSTELDYLHHLKIPYNTYKNNISISSDPEQVCFVDSNNFGCSKQYDVSIYPGQKFPLHLKVVGQMNGSVSGSIIIPPNKYIALYNNDISKHVSTFGEEVNYTIMSTSSMVNESQDILLFLNVQTASSSNSLLSRKLSPTVLTLNFRNCPVGFVLKKNNVGYHCNCSGYHFKNIIKCFLTHRGEAVIVKHKTSWIGRVNNSFYSTKYCPLDYCILTPHVNISNGTFLQQDSQCAYDRRGILCGSCKHNLSLVFGNNKCKKCSNLFLLLIIPFAVAGPLLVLLISYFDLTITTGSLNGIIFYVNIIQINSINLLSKNRISVLTEILQLFIAWLNLDLGIEVCFYDGMTAITKTILQAVFPMYLLSIALMIIIISRKSTRVTRLVGENAVKVLATLILLSYTKMIQVTSGSLNTAKLHVYNEMTNKSHDKFRWALDGSIPYFDFHNHMILVIPSVLFFCVSFPLTLSLLCIKYTYSLSHYSKVFSILNKLKPFYDAFTGPFKGGSRFWPGLLLVVRSIILVTRIVKISNFNIADYVAIIMCIALVAIMIFKNGVYKSRINNILEGFFLINLIFIFVNVMVFDNYDDNIQKLIRKISSNGAISLSLILLLGILSSHIYKRFSKMKWARRIAERFRTTESFDSGLVETDRRYEIVQGQDEDESAINSSMINYSSNN